MSKPDGGPAFPEPGVWDGDRNQVNPVGAYYDAGGMSLRDYFAAAALTGLFAAQIKPHELSAAEKEMTPAQVFAWRAYAFADGMIAERAKQ